MNLKYSFLHIHIPQSFFLSALHSGVCDTSFSLYPLFLFSHPSEHAIVVDRYDTTSAAKGTKMLATGTRITSVFGVNMCVSSRRLYYSIIFEGYENNTI
jgi:hypothetical protein